MPGRKDPLRAKDEYEGAETLGEGKRVNAAAPRGKFRELIESDEDA